MADTIMLTGMVFHAYHGTMPAERELGQKFIIDVEMKLDLRKAGESDDVNDTVDYGRVYADIKQVVECRKYRLLEALASELAKMILDKYPVRQVTVRAKKPQVPIQGVLDYAGVEITRAGE